MIIPSDQPPKTMRLPVNASFVRLGALKSLEEFQAACATLGVRLPAESMGEGPSPLCEPGLVEINGKRPGNRIVIHPMEGWDGTTTGGVTDEMRRRWRRFGESGAKMICGGEAMAVRPDGRANPNQLILNKTNQAGIAELVKILKAAHAEPYGTTEDLFLLAILETETGCEMQLAEIGFPMVKRYDGISDFQDLG